MRSFLFLIFLFSTIICCNQPIILSGTITGYPEKTIYIADFYGDQNTIIDSVRTDQTGSFEYEMSGKKPGMYRIIYDKEKYIDLIYNREQIHFHTTFDQPQNNIEFSSSIENLLWYDYQRKKIDSQYKLDLLNPLMIYYPESDSFYIAVRNKYYAIQKQFDQYVDKLVDLNPDTYTARYIIVDKPLIIDEDVNIDELNDYLRSHYFDNVIFDDSSLLRSNVISTKIIGYLALYRNPSFTKEEQEKSFIPAVDSILFRAMDNEGIFNFVLQYLIDGFELFGFDQVITHIVQNYNPAEICIHTGEKSELLKRMENLKKLAVGNMVPDILFKDNKGNTLQLYDLDSEYIIVLFWSSRCLHCRVLFPELMKLYDVRMKSQLEIMAISIDTNFSDYQEFINSDSYEWINHNEPEGWNSKLASDFSIYATPTMFLLDRNKKIVAKPMDAMELKHILSELD